FGSGNDVMTLNGGSVTGDVNFGVGNDTLTIGKAELSGNVDFGAGSNTLTIDGGGSATGRFISTGAVSMNLVEGYLGLSQGSSIEASNLTVGAKGSLTLMLDVDAPSAAPIRASGNVSFAEGSKLTLLLSDVITDAQRFTVLTASSIDIGSIN